MFFNRQLELHIGETNISGLDLAFHIEKSLSPEPSMAEIQIWNLGSKNRQYLHAQKSIPLTLHAGYQGSMGLLFKGDLLECSSVKEGPNWETTIRSGDGANAIKSARINKTFKAGTMLKAVIKEVASSLGLSVGDALAKLQRVGGSKRLLSGSTISGNSAQELGKLCESVGLETSVQDGALQILEKGNGLDNTAILLSPESGLIGSPELGLDAEIKARALLNHQISPGKSLQIRSAQIDQLCRVERAIYSGNTAGENWLVEIEARAL